jgi:hypothetical protein
MLQIQDSNAERMRTFFKRGEDANGEDANEADIGIAARPG